jgi:cyclopropane-fatty-acyl-phospholipid synthase
VINRFARAIVDWVLSRIKIGTLVIVENGRRLEYGGEPAPIATVSVHDPRAWRMLLRGSRGMADAYAAGYWDTPDLVAVIRLAAQNAVSLDRAPRTTTSATSCSRACSTRRSATRARCSIVMG